MKKIITSLLFLPIVSQANVNLEVQLLDLFQSNGTLITAGSKGILVASTTDSVFGQSDALLGLNLTVGSIFAGDDVVVGVMSASALDTNRGFADSVVVPYSGNLGEGDKLAFYWFPDISGSTVVGGSSYGFYRSDSIDSGAGGTVAFIAPATGSALTLAYYDTANGGMATKPEFTASLTVPVPEPSTYALMGLGLVVVGLMARRKKV